MKNKLLIAILIFASTQNTFAQWIPVFQDINTTYGDAAFPTDNTGYVTAADSGGAVVLCTTDGGSTWTRKHINGWNYIGRIAMTDSLSGYLIRGGVPVQLLKTSDGFTTYTIRNLDSCFAVLSLELLNDSTGYYLNNETRLRKFKNYGTSYFHVFDTLFDGQNLQFINPNTGFLDNGTRLLKTSDGGSTWNYVNSNLGFYTVSFKFADSLNGYFHDATTIYKTSDGGISFSQPYNFPNPVSFATQGNFCMVTNYSGDVAYTTDNAQTWQTEITGINWIVNESYIVKTTPGGSCFIFSGNSGEIRKRQPVIAGTAQLSGDKTIFVYPNPASDKIIINSNGFDLRNATVRLIDISGKLVFSQKQNDFSGKAIAIPSLISDGFYLLEVENPEQRRSKRLVIQRK